MKQTSFLFLIFVTLSGFVTAEETTPIVSQEILSQPVLPSELVCNQDSYPWSMMFTWQLKALDKVEQKWVEEYEKVKTAEQITTYQQSKKDYLRSILGEFPARTPLNPVITGTVERNGYKVEKVRFESQPSFWVTGLMFLPDESKFPKPWPTVLVTCGHTNLAKGYAAYQRVPAMLALNGIATLITDPIDQGERTQLHTPAQNVLAHCLTGVVSIPLGRNTAWFMIWDDIRSLDYLESRPDIDATRLGVCGNSGGGMQTDYLSILDDRVLVAAPACYTTSMAATIKMTSPLTDLEQNLFGMPGNGLEQADFCICRAPKPTLICCATNDFFSIKETWDAYRYSKRIYGLLGYSERMNLCETFNTHGWNKDLREATVRFMVRYLVGKSEAVAGPNASTPFVEPENPQDLTPAEFQVTPTGKVRDIPGSRTTYDINRDYAKQLTQQRAELWKTLPVEQLRDKIRNLAQFRLPSEIPPLKVFSCTDIPELTQSSDGKFAPLAEAKRIVFEVEEGLYLPAFWFVPHNAKPNESMLYVHRLGKSAGFKDINQLLSDGNSVLAVDWRGLGETKRRFHPMAGGNRLGVDSFDAIFAYNLGKSFIGYRTEDVYNLVRYLKEEKKCDVVNCYAVGNTAIPVLHAEFCVPGTINHLTIDTMLVSWTNFVENGGKTATDIASLVHGALQVYDLPELRSALEKEGKLTVLGLWWEKPEKK